jgi:glycosyltransferase involved in cell wall biosynthesis
MTDAKVSIIIPCYNAADCITEAVNSCKAQTYYDTEVIVVDDESTDGTARTLRFFQKDLRFVKVPHGGAASARNHGLALSKGQYIQFLDADDMLEPTKIEKQVRQLVDTGADLSICEGYVVDWERGEPLTTYRVPLKIEDFVVVALREPFQTSAPLHRREALQKIGGFRADLPCAQERDMHLRLAAAGAKAVTLKEELYTVRKRKGSISSDYGRVLRMHEQIFPPVYRELEARGELSEARARAFAEAMAIDARHLLARGEREKGLEYFEQAAGMHRSGGLDAFGMGYRLGYRLLGPGLTERLVNGKRFMRAWGRCR